VIAVRRVPLPGGGFGFWLESGDVAPRNDPAWDQAPLALRRQFWAEAGLYASRVWKRYRAAGFDRSGEQMDAISILTAQARQDDIGSVSGKHPYSPMGRASVSWKPLQATGGQSRLQSLLRWKTVGDGGVWFYWAFDRHTRHYWGEILARHARGFRQFFRYPRTGWGRVPGRDVLGFSDAEITLVREWMAGWWTARRHLVRPEAPVVRPGALRPIDLVRLNRTRPGRKLERVTRTPIVETKGVTLRLGTDGASAGLAIPPTVRPPRLRVPALVGPRPRSTGARVAAAVKATGWLALRWSPVWITLLEFVRLAAWDEVLDLFDRLGLPAPADRNDASEQLAAAASARRLP
jgi:hypothetical protein